MKLKQIEEIYTSVTEILPKIASVSTKVKLRLYLISIEKYKNMMDELRKEVVTQQVSDFESKRQEVISTYFGQSLEDEMNLLCENNKDDYLAYIDAVQKIESIYNYELEINETLSLTLDEVPDEIAEMSQSTQDAIFACVTE